MNNKKCYMCNNYSTTKEHVPPRCLFPEKKDLQDDDIDLRKNLITVPSCNLHNLKKSKDDEYLFFCLVLNFTSNNYALNQIQTKIVRMLQRNPKIINQFLPSKKKIVIKTNGELVVPFLGIEVNESRLSKSLEYIGRALYYYSFKRKWEYNVFVFPEFLRFHGFKNTFELNQKRANVFMEIDSIFKNKEFLGQNPEIFKYHIHEVDDFLLIMRFYFYEGAKTTLFFTKFNKKDLFKIDNDIL